MPPRDDEEGGDDQTCRQKELGWFVGGIGIGLLSALLVLVVFHLSKTGTLPSVKGEKFKTRGPHVVGTHLPPPSAICEKAFLRPADKAQCKKAAAICRTVPHGSDPITGLQRTQACISAVTALPPSSVGGALRASGHAKCLPSRAKEALEKTYTGAQGALEKLPALLDWTEQVSNHLPVCTQAPSRVHHGDAKHDAPAEHGLGFVGGGTLPDASSGHHIRFRAPTFAGI
jgi:hypothetical protein